MSTKLVYHLWNTGILLDTIWEYIVWAGPKYYGVYQPYVVVPMGTIVSICYIMSLLDMFHGKGHNWTHKANVAFFVVSFLTMCVDMFLYVFRK